MWESSLFKFFIERKSELKNLGENLIINKKRLYVLFASQHYLVKQFLF